MTKAEAHQLHYRILNDAPWIDKSLLDFRQVGEHPLRSRDTQEWVCFYKSGGIYIWDEADWQRFAPQLAKRKAAAA